MNVTRVERDHSYTCKDSLVEEVPVALVYNGVSHAVMLATPDDLEELALGFSLSEGILSSPKELYGLELAAGAAGVEVRMEIATRRFAGLKEKRRSLAGRTGCGLCGTESLAAIPRPGTAAPTTPVSIHAVSNAVAVLPAMQPLREATGAVHAAAWANHDGTLLALREDVGRHNALDKLIGWVARSGQSVDDGFVVVSSRASYEMVQKASAIGIGCLVAVSAPTALAVRTAEASGVALAGFARPGRLVLYTHPERFL
jgi:formate dehydrogenase accessory protein FdhD